MAWNQSLRGVQEGPLAASEAATAVSERTVVRLQREGPFAASALAVGERLVGRPRQCARLSQVRCLKGTRYESVEAGSHDRWHMEQ